MLALAASTCAALLSLGWVEPVRLDPPGRVMSAKLDTGAERTSLHAEEIRMVDGKQGSRVRFRLAGDPRALELPIVGEASVRQQGRAPLQRPLVHLRLCLAGRSRILAVSLADRSGYDYPLLVGRDFLGGLACVDAAARELTQPVCPTDEEAD
jgi:hypothetical protein